MSHLKIQNLVFILCVLILGCKSSSLNYVKDVTYTMSQLLGEQISFEYYIGYLPGDNIIQQQKNEVSLFFSLVTKYGETLQNTSKDTPVIFWLGGGPGFSSQEANWNQIGPVKLDKDLNASLRQFSWNNRALLVFVDQPIGTGLSYTHDLQPKDTKEAYNYFEFFLKKFYNEFDNLVQNPTYFSGSEFAGHFISYFGQKIAQNQPIKDFNFQGITLGNPWVDPLTQIQSVSESFFDFSIASKGQADEISFTTNQIKNFIRDKEYSKATDVLNSLLKSDKNFGYVDFSNFFHYNNDYQQNTNTNSTAYIRLLNNSVFRIAYYISNSAIPVYYPFNSTVYENFKADISVSYKQSLNYLIENNFNVMVYSGQLDSFINSAGIQNMIESLEIENFEEQVKQIFYQQGSDSAVWGNYQKTDNFVYVNIYQSGQHVPADQPEAALFMISNFLNQSW